MGLVSRNALLGRLKKEILFSSFSLQRLVKLGNILQDILYSGRYKNLLDFNKEIEQPGLDHPNLQVMENASEKVHNLGVVVLNLLL